MKMLVIGGSGFVSGAMVRDALAAGHEVWGLSRGNKPVPAGATAITADRHDAAAFAKAVADAGVTWELVIDCIGFNADDARQDMQVFAGRTKHLAFISTDCVISGERRPWRVDETYEHFTSSPYGANKRAAEQALIDAGTDRLPWTVLRPGHIYGPGSQLGCLPLHGRDPKLIDRLRAGEPLKLIGGGHLLQQPICVHDLTAMALGCADNERAVGEIYMAPGADVIASWVYYRIIADVLGVELRIEETSISGFLEANPTMDGFTCHRAYDDSKARSHGLSMPATPLAEGLQKHVEWMLSQA